MNADRSIFERWRHVQQISLLTGLTGALLCVIGFVTAHEQFYRSYLLAFIYWWEISIGCLGLAMLYRLVGGRWGAVTAPFVRAGLKTWPLIAVLFVPLLFGLETLYVWARPDQVAADLRL